MRRYVSHSRREPPGHYAATGLPTKPRHPSYAHIAHAVTKKKKKNVSCLKIAGRKCNAWKKNANFKAVSKFKSCDSDDIARALISQLWAGLWLTSEASYFLIAYGGVVRGVLSVTLCVVCGMGWGWARATVRRATAALTRVTRPPGTAGNATAEDEGKEKTLLCVNSLKSIANTSNACTHTAYISLDKMR